MKYKINDILFTKDGRKIGNCIIADIGHHDVYLDKLRYVPGALYLVLVSDYGNVLTVRPELVPLTKSFYATTKQADPAHKHYNYKDKFPEDFI